MARVRLPSRRLSRRALPPSRPWRCGVTCALHGPNRPATPTASATSSTTTASPTCSPTGAASSTRSSSPGAVLSAARSTLRSGRWLSPSPRTLGATSLLAHRLIGCLVGRPRSSPSSGCSAGAWPASARACSRRRSRLVYPTLVAADGSLMSETLYGTFVGAALLLSLRQLQRPAVAVAAALGRGDRAGCADAWRGGPVPPPAGIPVAWRGGRPGGSRASARPSRPPRS